VFRQENFDGSTLLKLTQCQFSGFYSKSQKDEG
jgi:hypothetical protein